MERREGRREERSGRGDKCVAGRVNVAGCGRPGVLTEEVEGKVGSAVVETALAVTRDNTCAAAVKDTVIMSMPSSHPHTSELWSPLLHLVLHSSTPS